MKFGQNGVLNWISKWVSKARGAKREILFFNVKKELKPKLLEKRFDKNWRQTASNFERQITVDTKMYLFPLLLCQQYYALCINLITAI